MLNAMQPGLGDETEARVTHRYVDHTPPRTWQHCNYLAKPFNAARDCHTEIVPPMAIPQLPPGVDVAMPTRYVEHTYRRDYFMPQRQTETVYVQAQPQQDVEYGCVYIVGFIDCRPR
jgi:hypothetical protein